MNGHCEGGQCARYSAIVWRFSVVFKSLDIQHCRSSWAFTKGRWTRMESGVSIGQLGRRTYYGINDTPLGEERVRKDKKRCWVHLLLTTT